MSWESAVELAERFPHTFTIQYPPARDFFRARFAAPPPPPADVLASPALAEQVLLYVHVPFCEAKCYYCNFAVDLRRDGELHRRYVAALSQQLGALAELLPPGCRVAGIDVGGGTPTLLPEALLQQLLAALQPWRARAGAGSTSTSPATSPAISIETTPRVAALEPAKLALLRDGGVERISVGLQSTNDETLAAVNRGAQRALSDRAVRNLLAAGFRRVHVDLVFGLPGQTAAHWQEDLAHVGQLGVDSITTYDCLYRGAGRAVRHVQAARPSAQQLGALYDLAYERLTQCGYHAPYGSVNFCRHAGETGTSAYFEGRLLDGLPYLGVGNYAASMVGPFWWFAPYGVSAYLDAVSQGTLLPAGDGYRLPDTERMAKALLFALHFGLLDPRRFARQFAASLDAVFAPQLAHALQQRWLCRAADGSYGVVPGAFQHMAKLRALFYSAAAIEWLQEQLPQATNPSIPGPGRRSLPVLFLP